jgi:hypothetical protein
LEDAQFGPPVRQRQAKALDVGIASTKLGFDRCDLALASLDSYRRSRVTFLGDLPERSAVAIELCLFAGQLLPALDDNVHILGIKFDAEADAFR